MNIKPIKSEADHSRALREINRLMNARKNTASGRRLDALATLVAAWEAKHHAIDTSKSTRKRERGGKKIRV